MIDVSATGRKSLNSVAPGFFGNGHNGGLFPRAKHRMCVYEQWEKSCKKRTKLIRANFHNTAPQAIGPVCFVWVNT